MCCVVLCGVLRRVRGSVIAVSCRGEYIAGVTHHIDEMSGDSSHPIVCRVPAVHIYVYAPESTSLPIRMFSYHLLPFSFLLFGLALTCEMNSH